MSYYRIFADEMASFNEAARLAADLTTEQPPELNHHLTFRRDKTTITIFSRLATLIQFMIVLDWIHNLLHRGFFLDNAAYYDPAYENLQRCFMSEAAFLLKPDSEGNFTSGYQNFTVEELADWTNSVCVADPDFSFGILDHAEGVFMEHEFRTREMAQEFLDNTAGDFSM